MFQHLPGDFEPDLQEPKPYAFETRWRAASQPLIKAIADLSSLLQSVEVRQRARKAADMDKFNRAVEAVCCNFVANFIAPVPSRSLMVMRGNYAASLSPVYGKHFNCALDLMESLGLITTERGGKFIRKDTRAPSTVRATAKLAQCLPAADWSALRLEDDRSTGITLKDCKADTTTDTLWLAKSEREMVRINAMVQSDRIAIAGNVVNEVALDKRATVILVSPHHRTLRRIFNGSYQSGGRLYGGVWETMPKGDRKHIRIDGEPVVNVDYGQFYLRMAYAVSGQSPPHGDLYDLTGKDHLRADWPEVRAAHKRMVNALISASRPLRHWPGTPREQRDLRAVFPEGTKAKDIAAAIKQRHHAIAAEWFERGRGLELMRRESDILVAVLLRLIDLDIIALPIHDSVIVRHDQADTVRRIMEEEAPGIPAKVSVS